jgi:hypothetical protein
METASMNGGDTSLKTPPFFQKLNAKFINGISRKAKLEK